MMRYFLIWVLQLVSSMLVTHAAWSGEDWFLKRMLVGNTSDGTMLLETCEVSPTKVSVTKLFFVDDENIVAGVEQGYEMAQFTKGDWNGLVQRAAGEPMETVEKGCRTKGLVVAVKDQFGRETIILDERGLVIDCEGEGEQKLFGGPNSKALNRMSLSSCGAGALVQSAFSAI